MILVTGGHGLVGTSLRDIVGDSPEFTFVSRNDYDLLTQTDELFEKYKPDTVVHLAAKVAGLYGNIQDNLSFLTLNSRMSLNVLEACKKFKVKRLINVLSTCIFPDGAELPLRSSGVNDGPPHPSNEGYAYAKRLLYNGSKHLDDTEVVNLIPTNLYGENDNYDLVSSHVIPGLIHKAYLASLSGGALTLRGRGECMRQFVYSKDFAKIILEFTKGSTALGQTHSSEGIPPTAIGIQSRTLGIQSRTLGKFSTLIVSPNDTLEISIKDVAKKIAKHFNVNVTFTEDNEGQRKKTASDTELLEYLPEFQFTDINIGLDNVVNYFKSNYNSVRGTKSVEAAQGH